MQGIKEGLESVGFHPQIESLDFFQDNYGLEVEEGPDSESDEFEEIDEEDVDGYSEVNGVDDNWQFNETQ